MRLPSRLSAYRSARPGDDADVIRARLRALLADGDRPGGWVPEDDDDPHAVIAPTAGAWEIEPEPSYAPERDRTLPPGIGRHRAPARTARWDPGRPGTRALWLAGLLAALVLILWTWLDRPRVQPASSVSEPAVQDVPPAGEPVAPPVDSAGGPGAPASAVVSVVGLVASPGLVTLPAGSRVADAVAAAGGLLADADPASVNLAATVVDGEQIVVEAPGSPPVAGTAAEVGGSAGGRLDVNTATAAELEQLPGIGPVLAERIVTHRTAFGRFARIDELQDVPGIGPTIFGQLADRVTV